MRTYPWTRTLGEVDIAYLPMNENLRGRWYWLLTHFYNPRGVVLDAIYWRLV